MRAVRALALTIALASSRSSPRAACCGRRSRRAQQDRPAHARGPAEPLHLGRLLRGAHAGYGWSSIDWQEGAFVGTQDGEGWLAGGQIGFNLQSGRLVYGIEADATATWMEGGNGCCSHSVELALLGAGAPGSCQRR